ncbi:unnamed protein product [Acanthosepion pharaonis]|uniref:Uncharacterized protein n=1 Tax=Acanthosepion pharaonis TaxID=158019 RepID=A0A812E7Z1_ACAPH|nr:unnamed protein product [Sepia pharaonis]
MGCSRPLPFRSPLWADRDHSDFVRHYGLIETMPITSADMLPRTFPFRPSDRDHPHFVRRYGLIETIPFRPPLWADRDHPISSAIIRNHAYYVPPICVDRDHPHFVPLLWADRDHPPFGLIRPPLWADRDHPHFVRHYKLIKTIPISPSHFVRHYGLIETIPISSAIWAGTTPFRRHYGLIRPRFRPPLWADRDHPISSALWADRDQHHFVRRYGLIETTPISSDIMG